MNVLTIGGATQDLYLHITGEDIMTITQQGCVITYLLFESGQKVEIPHLESFTGGGATNTAASFKKQGIAVRCFCAIGSDAAGQRIVEEFAGQGIPSSYITTLKEYPTGSSYMVNAITKERTIFTYRGANAQLDLSIIQEDVIASHSLLYITSLSQKATQSLPNLTAVAKKNNVKVAINPGSSQLKIDTLNLKESLKNIDILIVNSAEARTFMTALTKLDETYKKLLQTPIVACRSLPLNMLNKKPYLLETPLVFENYSFSLRNFFKEVLTMGPSIVVVTNGGNGVYAATQESLYFHPSADITVCDNIGAGDAFGSSFVGSLLLGDPLENALRNGIVNSASVLQKMGAKPGLLTRKQQQEQAQKLPKDALIIEPL